MFELITEIDPTIKKGNYYAVLDAAEFAVNS